MNKSFRWILFLPILVLVSTLIWGDLGADPAKKLNHLTGKYAFYYLLVNILIGSLLTLFPRSTQGFRFLLGWRRWLGVIGYFILLTHILFYLFIESFEFQAVSQIFSKNYLFFGFLASAQLSLLALTSNNFSVQKLGGKKWKRLHRLVYLVVLCLAGHLLLIEKADIPYYGSLFLFLVILGLWRGLLSFKKSRVRPS